MADIVDTSHNVQALFTCISCGIAFTTADRQRDHYKSDWHRYNLKRKVAELPPVSVEIFTQKVFERQHKTNQDASRATYTGECKHCNKIYYSPNAYQNHLDSKKHKETLTKASLVQMKSTLNPVSLEDKSEVQVKEKEFVAKNTENEESISNDSLMAQIDEKIATSIRLTETMCLFCTRSSNSFDANIDHMTRAHSFFIPDIEYLVDLHGLILYLGEKISIGHVCLYCNGKGKEWKSLEAVWKHMADKGHQKIAYDEEKDRLEISDYYDFTSSYPGQEGEEDDQEDEEWEDIDEEIDDKTDVEMEEVVNITQPRFGSSELELILPSGARIGHRSLHRYYKQSLKPNPNADDPMIINRLLTHYAENKIERQPRRDRGALIKARNEGEAREARKHIKTFADHRRQYQFQNRVAEKGNQQKHYRDQLLQ